MKNQSSNRKIIFEREQHILLQVSTEIETKFEFSMLKKVPRIFSLTPFFKIIIIKLKDICKRFKNVFMNQI